MIAPTDLAYVRFKASDLEEARRFLDEFGLDIVQLSNDRLFARSADTKAYVYEVERGMPGFTGFGFEVEFLDGFSAIGACGDMAMEAVDGPGGGRRVRLIDPDGIEIDVVAGRLPAYTTERPYEPWNHATATNRPNRARRVGEGPSVVMRLGHVVLAVSDLGRSVRWYSETFGLTPSDIIEAENGQPIAYFLRFDSGGDLTDHHSLALSQAPPSGAGLHHTSFEVADLDDLMAGHEHLRARGRQHVWGIGRHLSGSQVFDYWADPWGNKIEHWTDGDRFDNSVGAQRLGLESLLKVQWGPEPPADFGAVSPISVKA